MLYRNRIAAVLLLLFAVGHTFGFRQSDPAWGVDALLGSMPSIHFEVPGFNRTYWEIFLRRSLCRCVLSIRGDIGMATGCPSGIDFRVHARHCLGIRFLLCRYHGCKLQISLYPTYRFVHRDYIMFDCRDMASSKASFHGSVGLAR
jgi:hypothetical protein